MKRKFLANLLFLAAVAFSQSCEFDPAEYRQFLAATEALDAQGLLRRYPAGAFQAAAPGSWENALYSDSVDAHLKLTSGEKALIHRNGFMVSERLSYPTFMAALEDIYVKDLPLFISADAILHAVHSSYDVILKQTEVLLLLPELTACLSKMHAALPQLGQRYAQQPQLALMLRDLDLYLSVARRLLDDTTVPLYKANQTSFRELLALVDGETPADYKLFSTKSRDIDFSQFQVRGHYLDEYRPELARYFKAVMWLGRTEFYLIPPQQLDAPYPFADIQRQIIDALLLQELVDLSGAGAHYDKIDEVLTFFIGECDNVTLQHLDELKACAGIASADQLLDSLATAAFQDTLAKRSFAGQRINSQILWSDPLNPDAVKPAGSFLLLGQRFIIDSFITGQLVFDKILHDGIRVPRMLPSTLDVLFALGNDAAGQLLQSELERFHYAPNLAAVRRLVDGYDHGFWQSSLFNSWLSAIRGLNPPVDRSSLPAAMQTAAWWQRLMNTQLGSWAELRHDNLLYAKQSYTMSITCSFPRVYLEPAPEMFAALRDMAEAGDKKFSAWGIANGIPFYFRQSRAVFDTLAVIAQRAKNGEQQTEQEKRFLQRALYSEFGCNPRKYAGWYTRLYIEYGESDPIWKQDYIVADIHTAPTDEFGEAVGWVQHVGTGPINLGVMVLPQNGHEIAFAGPMMSYYEHLATNFHRLTDEEWTLIYNMAPSLRPDFCNLYLADAAGRGYEPGGILITGLQPQSKEHQSPQTQVLVCNYPNPFNATTLIHIVLPNGIKTGNGRLSIYDRNGREVCTLFSGTVSGGHYLARWDGCDQGGSPAASGIYFYRFSMGEHTARGKMSLVR
ncbi:MAG TPA: DUF3160 domain-containing protein [bacterium]|nr:DUF3160 domain-containing protein [bacterium]